MPGRARRPRRLERRARQSASCSAKSAVGRGHGARARASSSVAARRRARGRGRARSPARPCSSERSAFWSDSAKVRPIAITSPTDCIRVPSRGVGAGQLLELPARDLGDHVVDDRLEARRGHLGDVVARSRRASSRRRGAPRSWRSGTPSPWTRARSERETRGFISITRRSPVAGSTANCTLRAARLDARRGAARRRRRRASPGTRRPTASGSGATVIESPVCTPIGSKFSIEQTTTQLSGDVAHDLELELLPARDRALDEDLADRATPRARRAPSGRSASTSRRDPGAEAAEDEARADHDGEADARRRRRAPGRRVRAKPDSGVARPMLGHRVAEELAVLGGLDRLGARADHLDAVARRVTPLRDELHRQVERGLAAERRQQRVGALALDDRRSSDAGVEGLDVGGVGGRRVGHDRRGVRVHEHDAVALLAQHLAGLGPGVVELAGLADHDRARSR